MELMSRDKWYREIVDFDPERENFGDPFNMSASLIREIQKLRDFVGVPVRIHCGYESRDSGWHPKHRAVDLSIVGMHPIDMFLTAARFSEFKGIGVYSWWRWGRENIVGGIHVDNRPQENKAFWGQLEKGGRYFKADSEFLKEFLRRF